MEADSRLLWRSSKLTEGRNSKELEESPGPLDAAFRPKEKREWLLDEDACSIGSANELDAVAEELSRLFMGLRPCLALKWTLSA